MSVSATSFPSSTVHVIGVCVSSAPGKKAKSLFSGSLRIGNGKYELIRDEDGVLRQQFQNIVELSPETQISLSYKTSSLSPRPTTQKIDTHRLFMGPANSQIQDLSVVHGDVQVTFNCQAARLLPTTQAILGDCPQFRILVIGKSGVGKSTLIHIAFGINKAASADLQRGKADIEIGLESSFNKRFILHDSLGFEPGERDNYETVKRFIKSKQSGPLKDRLHAVWFCIRTPQANERLLEVAAEDFFRHKKQTMGAIPLIVVFTKLDKLVDERMMLLAKQNIDEEGITARARLEAESLARAGHVKISQLAGESLPYAIVSTRKDYEDTPQNLVELTHSQVGISNTPEAQVTSVVTLMAQRIDPRLKVHGSITVGRRKYWKALRSSPSFAGHTIWDCLSVIHTDIVNVWNFNDPACHLHDKKFKELVVEMVQKMELPQTNPNRVLALGGGGSLIAAVSGLLGAITNPAAPIVLPVVVGLAAALWLYDIYQNGKNVQRIFMAYIVDLTHIMETLFIVTAHDHNKLSRRAIKFARNAYFESDVRNQAHARIHEYRDFEGRDAALDMIESLIKSEQTGSSGVKKYYEDIRKLDLQELNLGQEEEW